MTGERIAAAQAAMDVGANVVLADIDLQLVRDKRRRFPVLTHRRL